MKISRDNEFYLNTEELESSCLRKQNRHEGNLEYEAPEYRSGPVSLRLSLDKLLRSLCTIIISISMPSRPGHIYLTPRVHHKVVFHVSLRSI